MKSPKQEFKERNGDLRKTIQQTVALLSSSNSSALKHAQEPSTTVIRTDAIALAQLLDAHITQLALLLKPPADFSGAFELLAKLHDDFAKLSFLAKILVDRPTLLSKELRFKLLDLFAALQDFHDGLDSTNRQEALQGTAQVWQSVKRLKDEVSADEGAAFKKALASQLETLEDAMSECKGLLEQEESEDTDQTDDEDFFSIQPLNEQEKCKANAAIVLLRLAKLLLKRLKSTSPVRDYLAVKHASNLIEAGDDMVLFCSPPQDNDALLPAFERFRSSLQELAFPAQDLAEATEQLSLEDDKAAADEEAKWRKMCITTVDKTIAPLLD